MDAVTVFLVFWKFLQMLLQFFGMLWQFLKVLGQLLQVLIQFFGCLGSSFKCCDSSSCYNSSSGCNDSSFKDCDSSFKYCYSFFKHCHNSFNCFHSSLGHCNRSFKCCYSSFNYFKSSLQFIRTVYFSAITLYGSICITTGLQDVDRVVHCGVTTIHGVVCGQYWSAKHETHHEYSVWADSLDYIGKMLAHIGIGALSSFHGYLNKALAVKSGKTSPNGRDGSSDKSNMLCLSWPMN